MRFCNNIFATLLKPLDRRDFKRIVARHDGDAYDKSLHGWDHLVALIFAQLSGLNSLRGLVAPTITKVTNATKSFPVQVSWYPNLTPVNWRNNHKIDELYELTQQHQETRDLEFIAGRIIHSFIHIPYVEEQGGLSGIFFTSDIDRNKKLYALKIDDVIAIFERVGNDNPINIYWFRHPNGEEITEVS